MQYGVGSGRWFIVHVHVFRQVASYSASLWAVCLFATPCTGLLFWPVWLCFRRQQRVQASAAAGWLLLTASFLAQVYSAAGLDVIPLAV